LIGVDYFGTPVHAGLKDHSLTDISPIADIPALKTLYVRGVLCDLSPIAKLNELESLLIMPPSGEGEIARLRKAMPDCRISLWDAEKHDWVAQ
jgi:hypothetical protein